MQTLDLIAVLTVLTAAFGYVNVRLLKLPPTIGLMALTLLFSMIVLAIGRFLPGVEQQARLHRRAIRASTRRSCTGCSGFLLFAGALHIDLSDLANHKWPIAVLASVGVLISTAIVGGLTWVVVRSLGFPMRFIDCLLFGALISPTDPIAVLSLLKRVGAPKTLEIEIAGESLFNDGVGVAVFAGLLEVATGERPFDAGSFALLFLREALGGALFGLLAGLLVYRLMKSVDHFRLEILLSLALVAGGYAAAEALHLSGPIAMVVAGLLIGNHGRSFAMSPTTIEHLDRFWGLLDELLNAALFVMIGIEVLVVTFTGRFLVAGLLAVAIVLLARLVSVGVPVWLLRRWERFEPSLIPILTWGGLRGGISVALALSLRGLGVGPRAARPRADPLHDLRRRGLLDPRAGVDRRLADPLATVQGRTGGERRRQSARGMTSTRRTRPTPAREWRPTPDRINLGLNDRTGQEPPTGKEAPFHDRPQIPRDLARGRPRDGDPGRGQRTTRRRARPHGTRRPRRLDDRCAGRPPEDHAGRPTPALRDPLRGQWAADRPPAEWRRGPAPRRGSRSASSPPA